jgi:hypothetical protein
VSPEAAKALAAATAFLTSREDSSHGFAVQLRSVSDGHLLRTLLPADRSKSEGAIVEPDGSLLLASGGRCSTMLTRLDLKTGQQRTVAKLPESASDIVVNPAGTKIAYVTYPTCQVNTCGNCASFFPNVLVVRDLITGRSTRTSTSRAGQPLVDLSWSPDGQQVAAAYRGDLPRVLRFNALTPKFAAARPLMARLGCDYGAATWTNTGIVAAQTCGDSNGFVSPSRLVETTLTGAVVATWPLPACVDGIGFATTPDRSKTLVSVAVGYGNGACRSHGPHGDNPVIHILSIDGPHLRPVVEFSDSLSTILIGY